jgi:hypothetical protein
MTTKTALVAFSLVLCPLALSGQGKPAGSLTDVSGVWVMLIEGHQVGLELEQTDTEVKGVILVMGQRQLLEGTYIERTLTLKGEKTENTPPAQDGGALGGPITAQMLDDGTLEGELTTNHGRMKWTGERLQKRPGISIIDTYHERSSTAGLGQLAAASDQR